jgi:hypothetical protein
MISAGVASAFLSPLGRGLGEGAFGYVRSMLSPSPGSELRSDSASPRRGEERARLPSHVLRAAGPA